jgi:hypothetical protein
VSRARGSLLALAGLLGVALAYGLVAHFLPLREQVGIGAGLLAKQMCSCIYVAQRSPEACRADQRTSLDPIAFELRRDEQRVWAGVRLLGERIAVHRAGFGCTLE